MTDQKQELIVAIDLTPEKAVELFTSPDEFEKLFSKIKAQTDAHVPDLETAKGRDALKSLAYKVTRTKGVLDDLGKGVKEEAQKTVNAVDATRKDMRERLDALKDEVRKPLTEFEAREKKLDEAADNLINKMVEIKNVPFGASVEFIDRRIEDVEEIATYQDWRGKDEKAAGLIDACRSMLTSARAAAIQAAQMAAENERLRQEKEKRDEYNRIERERVAQEQKKFEAAELARAAELERQSNEQKIKDEAAQAEIERLKQVEADGKRRIKEAEEAAELAKQQAADTEARLEREAAEKAEAQKQQQASREAEEAERVVQREKAEKEAEAQRVEAERVEAERLARLEGEREERIFDAVEDLYRGGMITNLTKPAAEEIVRAIVDGAVRNITFN